MTFADPVKPLNPIFMTEPKAQAQPLTVEFGPEVSLSKYIPKMTAWKNVY